MKRIQTVMLGLALALGGVLYVAGAQGVQSKGEKDKTCCSDCCCCAKADKDAKADKTGMACCMKHKK